MSLKNKKAIITGGSRGIGFATAKKFIEEGAVVTITGRNAEALKKACAKIPNGNLMYVEWDTADISMFEGNIKRIADNMDGLDILVNNAGVLTETDFKGEFLNITPDQWDYVENINLKGVFFMCQAAAKYMMGNKIKGHIVNVCSEMGFRPVNVTYGITKWGVRGMTYGLGKTLAPYGIVVNGVAPGATATDMMRWSEGMSMERLSHPNRRFGYPCEIAALIAFLASNAADNLVGEIVISDGGSHLY